MTSRVQIQRFPTTATRPSNGTRPPGEFWLNFPDLRLGMIDPTQAPVDILPIRVYAPTATYALGDYVVNAGQLQRARTALNPKPYASTDWDPIPTGSSIAGTYLALAGGNMLGPLTLATDPTQPLQAVTKRYSDTKLPLAGGVLTGPLTLSGNATANLQPTTLQQMNAADALRLPLTGGVLSGPLTLSGNATTNLQPVTLFQLNNTVSNYLPIGGGVVTGGLTVNGNILGSSDVYVTGNLHVQPYNNWEWTFGTDTSGNHYQTFRSGWFNQWRTTDGLRIWAGPGGTLMTLDGNGNLNVQTAINTGTVGVNVLNTNTANVNGPLNVTGWATFNNSIMNNSGTFYVAGNANYYFQRASNDGAWRFVENGTITSTLDPSGNLQVRGNISQSGGGIYASSGGFNSGGDIQMNGHWIQGLGAINSNATVNGDAICYHLQTTQGGNNSWAFGISGGYGFGVAAGQTFLWAPASDARFKTNVVPSVLRGIDLIEATPIVAFDMKLTDDDSGRHADIGFVADETPAALTWEVGGTKGIDANSALAAAFDAVKELAARVAALEAHKERP